MEKKHLLKAFEAMIEANERHRDHLYEMYASKLLPRTDKKHKNLIKAKRKQAKASRRKNRRK